MLEASIVLFISRCGYKREKRSQDQKFKARTVWFLEGQTLHILSPPASLLTEVLCMCTTVWTTMLPAGGERVMSPVACHTWGKCRYQTTPTRYMQPPILFSILKNLENRTIRIHYLSICVPKFMSEIWGAKRSEKMGKNKEATNDWKQLLSWIRNKFKKWYNMGILKLNLFSLGPFPIIGFYKLLSIVPYGIQ